MSAEISDKSTGGILEKTPTLYKFLTDSEVILEKKNAGDNSRGIILGILRGMSHVTSDGIETQEKNLKQILQK